MCRQGYAHSPKLLLTLTYHSIKAAQKRTALGVRSKMVKFGKMLSPKGGKVSCEVNPVADGEAASTLGFERIDSLCPTVQRCSSNISGTPIGFLDTNITDHILSISFLSRPLIALEDGRPLSTLQHLLSQDQDPPKLRQMQSLSLADRLRIAVILAQSWIEYWNGSWSEARWGGADVYFYHSAGTPPRPFLQKKFNSNACAARDDSSDEVVESSVEAPPPVAVNPHPNVSRAFSTSLLGLGVLILELWHGKTIESQPFFASCLGRDDSVRPPDVPERGDGMGRVARRALRTAATAHRRKLHSESTDAVENGDLGEGDQARVLERGARAAGRDRECSGSNTA